MHVLALRRDTSKSGGQSQADEVLGPDQKLELFARYLSDGAANDLADELNFAWELVERLRHKAGIRESMASPPQPSPQPLLPATQLPRQKLYSNAI